MELYYIHSMPKRTRAQKERARERQAVLPSFTDAHEDVHSEHEARIAPVLSRSPMPILSDTDLRAIKQDLVKIALFTLIALGSQLILYSIS